MSVDAPVRDTDSIRFPDGSAIVLRPIGVSDGRLVSSFAGQLSQESEYKRFLSAGGGARARWVASLINADQSDALVFGAVARNEFGSGLVAIAESIRDPGDRKRAEFALAATDTWQNMGIGTLLTRHVARIAFSRGIRFWETYMLADNTRMARVMDGIGSRVRFEIDLGLAYVVHQLATDLR